MSFVLQDKHFTQTRLRSLYSDFSHLKETNPEGYDANMQAWTALLTMPRVPIFENHCVVDVAALKRRLRLDSYGEPACLGLVLKKLVSEGAFMDLGKYKSRVKSIHVREWSIDGVVQWIVGASVGKQLVSLTALESLACHALKLIGDGSACVHRDQVEAMLNAELEKPVSRLDLDCLLLFLSRDKGEVSVKDTLVKHPAGEITDADVAQAELRYTIWKLESQIERTTAKILQLKRSALDYSKQGNAISARSSLQLKKAFEKSLSYSNGLLIKATETLQNIEIANVNLGFVSSLKSGVSALKSLNDKFNADDIEELRDELKDLNEASSAITLDNNDSEVEEEYQKLVAETENDSKLLERLQGLSISKGTLSGLEEKAEKSQEKDSQAQREQIYS